MEKKNKANFIERLKAKWGVKNYWQVGIILIVFSLAGSTIAYTKSYYFSFLGIGDGTHWSVKLLIALLVYQVVLLFYGTLLGQFKFFWRKEKKMFLGLGNLILKLFTLPLALISKKS